MMPDRCLRVLSVLGLPVILLAMCASPGGAAAQGQDLLAVERLADDGRFVQARAALTDWLDGEWSGATRADRQLGVWLRALLSLDPDRAELDYRRLVVEYPGGAYSDQALIRLAQGSLARSDVSAAQQYLTIFLRDYPESPLRVEARSLMSRLEEGPVPDAIAVLIPTLGPGVSSSPPSLPTDTPPPAPPPSSRPTIEVSGAAGLDERSGTDPFTLQLGAFFTEGRALSLTLDARVAGLEPRLVRVQGSELLRVRLGRFATREEAEARAEALRELGFQAVISSDRALEEEIP
ncbi:MAG: hypothetical protein EXR92_01390 [Gemmatimonadetes bacterium]|nr:hypothetical protein [Gemmatimonadota bacterium]